MSTNVPIGFDTGAVLPGARRVDERSARKTTCAAM